MEHEKKKVGILNVQWVDNYGAVLLAYALQATIDSMGYQAEVVDYRPINISEQKSLSERIKNQLRQNGVKGIIQRVVRKVKGKQGSNVNVSSKEKHEKFEAFRRKYLQRSVVCHTLSDFDALDYDIYVVGSDVIWKPDRVKSEESDVYFLNFTKENSCGRIAYAASIGTDDTEQLKAIENKMGALLRKFDCVSVREKTSLPFVQSLWGKNVTWCIDPTMLLERCHYDRLLKESGLEDTSKDRYIYLYLFENNLEAIELANKYSKALNLPIICQCGLPEKIDRLFMHSKDDGPTEFVYRIKNADFVITDSFHGTVFSIIYQKNFITLSRGKISIRMQDLLERMNLLERYVENPSEWETEITPIDYRETEKIIHFWRTESMDYLINALGKWGGYYKYLIISIAPLNADLQHICGVAV